jgi:excisionase family DNA binding protein
MGDIRTRILLTRREAADALGISIDTLGRLLDRGELRAVRVGRSVLVPTSDVQSFVDRRLSETSDAKARAVGA